MPDILNPSVPGVSYSPYPPEMQQDVSALRRRRAIADMLLMRTFQPQQQPTGPGGIPVPMSPFAALQPLLAGVVGAYAQNKADTGERDLATKYSAGLSGAIGKMQDAMKAGDFQTASTVANQWPALKTISEKLMERQLPQNVIHETYGPTGQPQPSVVDLHAPATPPVPLGAPKPPTYHPVETASPEGTPQTSFVDLTKPPTVPLPKPNPLMEANVGGTTEVFPRYGEPKSIPHTIDPNRIPAPEDMPGIIKAIGEYRQPGYTGNALRSPGAAAIMAGVFKAYPNYDAAVFPVAKAGEINFIEKNGPQIRAFGTLARHVEAAKQLFTALDNPTDIPRINQARNFFQQEFGAAPPTQVNLAKQFIADEMAKAVLTGPGALDDRKHFAEALSRSASPAQFMGDLDTTMKFAVEQMKGHEQQYKSMTKSNRADFQTRFLDPQMQEIYQRYGGGKPSGGAGLQLPDSNAIDAELRRRSGG